MERGVANVFAHIHRIGISAYLGLGLLHGFLHLRVRGPALEVFQLDDVGMLHVGEKLVARAEEDVVPGNLLGRKTRLQFARHEDTLYTRVRAGSNDAYMSQKELKRVLQWASIALR